MCSRLLICCLLISAAQAPAAVSTSAVLDDVTRRPLAFVNVSIPAKGVGTVTDEQGHFNLDIEQGTDTLVLSMIGYNDFRLSLSRPLPTQILLTKKQTELDEVVVKPIKKKYETLGNRTKHLFNSLGFGNARLGWGIGTLIHINRSPVFIERLQFNIKECTYDSLLVRINIYELVNSEFVTVLKEPLYVWVTRPYEKLNELRVDVRDRNICVYHDFMVSLEIVKNAGPGKISFCARKRGSPTYMLLNPGSKWEHIIHGSMLDAVGFSALVSN